MKDELLGHFIIEAPDFGKIVSDVLFQNLPFLVKVGNLLLIEGVVLEFWPALHIHVSLLFYFLYFNLLLLICTFPSIPFTP